MNAASSCIFGKEIEPHCTATQPATCTLVEVSASYQIFYFFLTIQQIKRLLQLPPNSWVSPHWNPTLSKVCEQSTRMLLTQLPEKSLYHACKPRNPGYISDDLSVIDQRGKAMQRGDLSPFRVYSDHVTLSTDVQDLGICLDSDNSMWSQVSQTVSHCFYILCQIRFIHRSVSCTVFQSLFLATLANNFEGIRLLPLLFQTVSFVTSHIKTLLCKLKCS